MRSPSRLRIGAAGLVTALLATVLAAVAFVAPAAAAPPVYVVAGDDPAVTGSEWGLHDGAPSGGYFSELRAIVTGGSFGASGASFTIGAPRTVPLTATSLNGIDVYFLSARDLAPEEVTHLNAFVARGGAVIANSNAPGYYDVTAWAGFTLSPRVVFGDGPAPYDTSLRAPSPSQVTPGGAGHPLMNGPGGVVTTFDNWHSVAGFNAIPSGAVALARTTLTGPASDSGSASDITITNVTTLAAIAANPATGSGPIVATSDVDTFANAYRGVDPVNNLTPATGNGRLARNTFAWIADQLASIEPAPPSGFVPLAAPVRVLDSRQHGGAFAHGQARVVSLAAAGVPADATLVAINLTAVTPSADGYLTAWPTGGARPGVSSVNFARGVTIANAAHVAVGAGNTISVYNFGGTTDVLVDVAGYVAPSSGSRLVNVTPSRIKDTRSGLGGTGIANAGTTQTLRVRGVGGVPANATAVVLNLTAVSPTATSFVTAWPADRTRPTVSNINTTAGTTLPNLVVVRIPASGDINLYNHSGATHLVADVLGYYAPTTPSARITPLTPARVVDTRPTAAPLGSGQSRQFNTGITGATAVIVNVTVTEPTSDGYLTVYPVSAPSRPEASNLNFTAGRSVANLVMVQPTADGRITVFNSVGSTHVLVDVIARVDA